MARMKENPRYNVVSLRLTDEEREILEDVKRLTKRSVSELMREAMGLLSPSFGDCRKR